MDVFISYSSVDRALVENIQKVLDDNNISSWVDYKERSIGSNYQGDIVRAIREVKVFLIFLSEASVKSDNVFRELSMASEAGVAIIPVMIGNVKFPDDFSYYLRSMNYIVYEQNEEFINKLLNEICNKLEVKKTFDISKFDIKSNIKSNVNFSITDKKKFVVIAVAVLLAAIIMGVIIGGNKDNEDKKPEVQQSESFNAPVSQDTVAQPQTTEKAVTEAPGTDAPQTTESEIEIPSEYAQAIEEFKYSSLAKHPALNHTIKVGEKVTLNATWDKFYVVDPSIASIEGKLVTGLSPGTTYIVESFSATGMMGSVFKIVVTE